MNDSEPNKYMKFAKQHAEEEQARRAALLSEDNPYRKFIPGYNDEEDGEEEDSDVSNPTQPDLTPTLELTAVRVSERELSGTKPKLETIPVKDQPLHIQLGGCVVHVIRQRGEDLMFTGKAAYRYSDGLWSMATEGLAWLNVYIERAAKQWGKPTTIKLINEARAWIQRQEILNRDHDDIQWDQHGMVPTRSGLVDPRTGEIRPIRPDDFCTWRIEAEYDPSSTCPHWLQMLEDVFADRTPDVRAATIGVIQELLGAGLIDRKPRGLSKALIFQGGSNFGKSGLLEVLGGLFGSDVNGTALKTVNDTHGMMQFVRRRPWVLHEAFDQREWHLSSNVKAIITGDPIPINIKNGPLITQRIDAPIFWGTNHPPQFKESTRAIVNRIVVIECRREFFPEKPVGAGIEAAKRGLAKPSSLVLAEELPGILTWALQGLQRALERGFIELTTEMKSAGEKVRDDSNLVAGFLDECVCYDQNRRLSTPDFSLAFSAWWLENKGENRSVPSNDFIGKALLAMSDAKIAIDRKELKDMHRRYYCGIVLNEAGLGFHKAGLDNRNLDGKTANATDLGGAVNSSIPGSWDSKPSIIAMRKRQSF